MSTLNDWLVRLESVHPLSMDFKLERIIHVYQKMALSKIAPLIVTVAGTNGKGSTSTTIAALFQAHGAQVGLYTSPHIHRFNERIAINQQPASDAALIQAFEVIDHVRGEITLTYFEYATLAAFYHFHQAHVDVAVLEVGLGGRLDATNIVDADIAVITPIGIDHTQQLGSSIGGIAAEKAGIIKPKAQVICAQSQPALSIMAKATEHNAPLYHLGRDFQFTRTAQDLWQFSSDNLSYTLKAPNLVGDHQYQNAATAIKALMCSPYRHEMCAEKINHGLASVQLKGRLQKVLHPSGRRFYFDVAHNIDGAKVLQHELKKIPHTGQIIAIIGMLADKDARNVATQLNTVIDVWIAGSLTGARGQSADALAQQMGAVIPQDRILTVDNISLGCEKALSISNKSDIILVFGSFHTVCEGLNWINTRTNNA